MRERERDSRERTRDSFLERRVSGEEGEDTHTDRSIAEEEEEDNFKGLWTDKK